MSRRSGSQEYVAVTLCGQPFSLDVEAATWPARRRSSRNCRLECFRIDWNLPIVVPWRLPSKRNDDRHLFSFFFSTKIPRVRRLCPGNFQVNAARRGEESFNFVYASTLEDVNTVSQFTDVIFLPRLRRLRYDYGVIISDCYYG